MQKLTEYFNKFRKERCFKLFNEIHARWLEACDPHDLKIICDVDLEGKHLDELGDAYFEIGFDGNFTRLPLIDTIACFTLLEQAIQGKELRVVTSFAEDDVFELLEIIYDSIGIDMPCEN